VRAIMSREAQDLFNRIAAKKPDLAELLRMLESAEHRQAMRLMILDRKYADYREKMIERYGEDEVSKLEMEALGNG